MTVLLYCIIFLIFIGFIATIWEWAYDAIFKKDPKSILKITAWVILTYLGCLYFNII